LKDDFGSLYSKRIIAGSRTYFFDVKETGDGVKYLTITESRKMDDGEFRRERIFIFEEYIDLFIQGLMNAVDFTKKQ